MGISTDFESNSIFSIEPYLVDEKPTELSSSVVRPKFVIFPNHIRNHPILKNVLCLGSCYKPWELYKNFQPYQRILCDCSFQSPQTNPRIGAVGQDYFFLAMSFVKNLEAQKIFNLSMTLEDIKNIPSYIEGLRERFRKVYLPFYRSRRKHLTAHHWYEEKLYPQYWLTRVYCPEREKRRFKYPRCSTYNGDFRNPMDR